ncbi:MULTISPECIES: hypothetical protein [Mucilaginibacter]|uniref:Uncharacterized protein n=1 Tax=Mucilaginibacter rubeus TaxID=2027860 RepID=A0ABX7U788_9SPHI|nr:MULTISPECIES: hypothetical protein [Mucilaginibacter]QTE41085.1 hypothetical protein J3L19_19210 [Mucilaginibacter rubeus]QTE47688.1 hypothetical protein J3L21_19190 [Mucilaginibacter rubeus]QTE61460.1 hypothetical protein J3L22_23000 [Mucilaginibacter rubeus]
MPKIYFYGRWCAGNETHSYASPEEMFFSNHLLATEPEICDISVTLKWYINEQVTF